MKRLLITLCLGLIMLSGCKNNPAAQLMDKLSTTPKYAGAYLETDDVLRVGHGLDTAQDDTPVKWENPNTRYQYSMIVFDSVETGLNTTRNFSLLAIDTEGQAEVLNLRGISTEKSIWAITATQEGAPIGKVGRMNLPPTATPRASLASNGAFKGFVVVEE